MKNIPAKYIQRISLMIAMLFGFNLTPISVFAQNTDVSVKIQLLSEALHARDNGDLLLAKEKVEKLLSIAPDDSNLQSLLIEINESIEEKGIYVPSITSQETLQDNKATSSIESEEDLIADEPKAKATIYVDFDNDFSNAFRPLDNMEGLLSPEEVSPAYVSQRDIVKDLILVANSQIAAGDLAGAASTLLEIEARDPNSEEAKLLSLFLSEKLDKVQGLNVYKTRMNMLNAVNNNWEQPKVFELQDGTKSEDISVPSLLRKIENITLPKINFTGMALTRVIETLSELSVEYDSEGQGVNIIPLFDSSKYNPNVNITLRNLSLDKILKFVTQQVNFTYEVGSDAVTIQPSDSIGGTSSTITEFFPISRASVIQITGFLDSSSATKNDDPWGQESNSLGTSRDQEKNALQKFFQNAGVNFEGVTGSSLAFDGEKLIITQTPRNIERLRVILANYNQVKQVEIEAKFLEVSQNDLEEVGFDWGISQLNADGTVDWTMASDLRSLSDVENSGGSNEAFIIQAGEELGRAITIDPPTAVQNLDFGNKNALFSDTAFSIDDLDIDLQIKALARKSGSDLMSAPKVTVLSGKQADITIAQELRYPQSYGDIESTVSSGGGAGSSSAVSITAGTPEEFTTRNVGVEMTVTPNVASDNTISLKLQPRVTEFEGFVDYGGPSIALSGDTTAIVPAGFYQPIFSTREISTEVTIYDGATVVMGGLTRDEIRTVNDKVPVLGDLPGIGRFFSSEGETRQKKNLLIFVTANLVNPGGSLSHQSYENIKSNTIYQSPSLATPSGGNFRNVTIKD